MLYDSTFKSSSVPLFSFFVLLFLSFTGCDFFFFFLFARFGSLSPCTVGVSALPDRKEPGRGRVKLVFPFFSKYLLLNSGPRNFFFLVVLRLAMTTQKREKVKAKEKSGGVEGALMAWAVAVGGIVSF